MFWSFIGADLNVDSEVEKFLIVGESLYLNAWTNWMGFFRSGVVTNQEVRSAAAGENVAVGLLVRQVNEGGKAHAQSILSSGDLITEINGASLYGLTFEAWVRVKIVL